MPGALFCFGFLGSGVYCFWVQDLVFRVGALYEAAYFMLEGQCRASPGLAGFLGKRGITALDVYRIWGFM